MHVDADALVPDHLLHLVAWQNHVLHIRVLLFSKSHSRLGSLGVGVHYGGCKRLVLLLRRELYFCVRAKRSRDLGFAVRQTTVESSLVIFLIYVGVHYLLAPCAEEDLTVVI